MYSGIRATQFLQDLIRSASTISSSSSAVRLVCGCELLFLKFANLSTLVCGLLKALPKLAWTPNEHTDVTHVSKKGMK